ncbi:isoquinoline 1-oxidoreductase subunit beta [Gammaproteobacteria bacterium]
MNEPFIKNPSRRNFMKATSGVGIGLVLGILFDPRRNGPYAASLNAEPTGTKTIFAPNAFVRIGTDDTVTVIVKHLEMGQGSHTGLSTLVAEELDAAWSQIRTEGAAADPKRYRNLLWGTSQGTGGSTAIANSFDQMRRAGAVARAMLVAAAAQEWNVALESIRVSQGVLSHPSGKQASFGQMAIKAALQPIPEEEVTLKDPKDFIYIGKHPPRIDSHAKLRGTAIFTQDFRLPDLITAVVAHPPLFGATVKSFDATQAKSVEGVLEVVAIPSGVAVVAKDFWSAKKGCDRLVVDWNDEAAFQLGSTEILAQYRDIAKQSGTVAAERGNVTQAIDQAAKTLEAEFEFPYLAHAPMEPLNCVVQLHNDGCEVWNGAQMQTGDQHNLATLLGLKPEQIKINMLYAGGSFGRRANPKADYLIEAANIARALMNGPHAGKPVKLQWTRKDDMRAGFYRPAYLHRITAGLDAEGNLLAWNQRIVGQSIITGTPFEAGMVKNGVDITSVEGAVNLPYTVPHFRVDLHSPRLAVPVLWWRSVGSSHTAFAVEACLDELAYLAGRDPVAWRRELLKDHPRHRSVLDLAAEQAEWNKPLAPGLPGEKRGRGIAVHESFHSFVAQVAEVTVRADGSFRINRVVCAVDCGLAVNPDIIRAQMESGIVFGLTAACYGAITLHNGQVKQSSFRDYPLLRIDEMPRIEVHIVPSSANPTGVGEPGTPVIAPAVANALFAATGQRLRRLPFKLTWIAPTS